MGVRGKKGQHTLPTCKSTTMCSPSSGRPYLQRRKRNITWLVFTGPPVPVTARVHTTPIQEAHPGKAQAYAR
eukprot:1195122-Prorocentrum_minimum.AAC.2